MIDSNENRTYLTRFVQFFLSLDGLLHGLEVISAYTEEAWTTFALTTFHACIFFFAAYFVGHSHAHHGCSVDEVSTSKSTRWKQVLFILIVLISLLIFSPLGEGILPESLHMLDH